MRGAVSTLLVGVPTVLAVLLGIVFFYFKFLYKYFENRGIPYDRPTIPFGSFTSLAQLKKPLTIALADLYKQHKRLKLVGIFAFWKKQILINDPEIIKTVLVKDFDIFEDRGVYYNKKKDPLSAHLFALDGDEWKSLRTKLSPTFTSGKMKGMFPSVLECASVMVKRAAKMSSENNPVNCQTLFNKYGLAVISTTAFGLESDALTNDDSLFVKMANAMVAPTADRIMTALFMLQRDLAKFFNMRVVPPAVSDFFLGIVKDSVKYREDNGVTRNDYLQLLIQLKENGLKSAKGSEWTFSVEEMAAESFVFILAGSETTSSVMSFCLHELSLNPEIQDKLQEELDKLEELTYDSITNLEYLDMVVDETLRKYPALGFVNRECLRDYEVPGTKYVIEKGTQIFISTHGLHHDPDHFPDPERFDPERFSKENKNNIKPYTYMPFGEGPRFCIGMRFGKVQVKTGLVMMLRNFRVLPSEKEVKFESRSIITLSAGGLWFNLQPRYSLPDVLDSRIEEKMG